MSDPAPVGQPLRVFGSLTGPEEVEALTPSIIDGWMGMGPRVAAFEQALSDHVGTGFAMTSSGSSALYLAVAALGLPPGSEVVVPSFTWVACAHSVIAAGLQPVFADVDVETQNVDVEAVERVLTPKTAAVMVVHYAGRPARVDEISRLGLPIIEDAAHAIDSKLGGTACGALGRIGIFSFDSVKNLATPDGGGVATGDPDLLERVKQLRYCGIGPSGFARAGQTARWWEHSIDGIFTRATPNDIAASIGLVQLERLPGLQEQRARMWRTYQEQLAGIPWLVCPEEPARDERHSFFTYLIRVVDGRRDALASHLLERGIYTTLRYQPLHLSPIFESDAVLPGCEQLSEEGLNLPLHPRLSDTDLGRVIDALRHF